MKRPPMTPDELARALRAGIAALETGSTVVGDLHLSMFAGIHPGPGETITYTIPITLTITGRE